MQMFPMLQSCWSINNAFSYFNVRMFVSVILTTYVGNCGDVRKQIFSDTKRYCIYKLFQSWNAHALKDPRFRVVYCILVRVQYCLYLHCLFLPDVQCLYFVWKSWPRLFRLSYPRDGGLCTDTTGSTGYTVYTVQYTLYTVQYTLYTVQ